MNEIRRYICICLLLFLTACQSVQVSDSSHITQEDVVIALQRNGVDLVEADFPENVFGSVLENVKPGTYELNGKPFFIFEFNTENDRENGEIEFDKKTGTMELVSASTFKKEKYTNFLCS